MNRSRRPSQLRARGLSAQPAVQALESRFLLSNLPPHVLSVSVEGRHAVIQGTPGNDRIQVQVTPRGLIRIETADGTTHEVKARSLEVRAGAGDDQVSLVGRVGPGFRAHLYGEAGNDQIIGGPGRTTIVGGPGTNEVYASSRHTRIVDETPASPTFRTALRSVASSTLDESDLHQLVDLTNALRRSAGLSPLSSSPQLDQAAQWQADQMASISRLAHSLPGARYPELQDRVSAAHFDWSSLAENIAFGTDSSSEVLRLWTDSEPHRRNMLDPSMTEIGVASARSRDGLSYWAMVLARPA